MEELIIKLLKENGRIIVPDFGAFILKTKSPIKAIFNEFLQYNDGTLITGVSELDKTDRDNAAKKVKAYVDELVGKLNNNESVVFPEIGSLTKSSTGKITLGEGGETEEEPSAPKADKVKNTVEFDVSEEKPAEKKPKEEPVKPKASATNIPPKPKPTPSKPEIKQPEIENRTPPAPESTPLADYYTNEASGTKRNVILWIVLIVVVNAIIIGYFLFNDEIKSLFNKKKDFTKETIIETPVIEVDSATELIPIEPEQEDLVIEQSMEETNEPEQPSKELSGKKYFVVAGVFSIESNADNFVTELQQKGYNAEKFGKIGSMWAVSYDVFPTKKEADQLMLKIKRESDPEAWIRIVD